MRSITDSLYGVFVKIEGKNILIPAGNKNELSFKRKIVEENEMGLVVQIELINNRTDDILVNSILVSEFILSGKVEKVLENGWGQSSFSGYRTEMKSTKQRRFILKRDQNPNSFKNNFGYLQNSMVNEWFTQIVFSEKSCVIGAVTMADQFSQIYLLKEKGGLRVRVACQLDGLILKPGEKIVSEKIAIVSGIGMKETLENYADLISKYSKTRSVKNPPVGLCCAYYYQGNVVSEEYLLDQIRALSLFRGKTALQYLEIDAGYCVWGDWLEINGSFPSGMEKMVKEVRKIGLKAGIWFAPYVASSSSKVYREHPNWFLRNAHGMEIEGRQSSPFDFWPSLSLKVMDPTHPEVQAYIKKVVRQFLDWGFEMLKVDFTYPICFAHHYFQPMTRAQALRMGYLTIRKATGEKIHLMSAITQLSPLVGVVDSARVGIDTINPYVSNIPIIGKLVNRYMFRESIRNNSARLFLNGKVWINDADCFIGRAGAGLTRLQVDEQFDFIKKNRGAVWIGDSLKSMTKSNLDKYIELFKKRLLK